MTCPAIKQCDRQVCGKNSTCFEGYCRTHYNVQCKNPEFRAREAAHRAHEEALQQQRVQAIRDANLARVAAVETARLVRRTEQIAKNNRTLAELSEAGSVVIYRIAVRIVDFWRLERIPGYDCVKAYAVLKYKSVRHPGLPDLLRAATIIHLQTGGNHPDYPTYTAVPLEERNTALNGLRDALVPYGDINVTEILRVSPPDKHLQHVINRQQAEARAAAEAAAAAAAAAQEALDAAQRAEMRLRLQREAVVFKRDPEGSVDLRAMAGDKQSVHRSSVQSSTEKAVRILLSRPVDEDQETLAEIEADFNNPKIVRFSGTSGLKDRLIIELQNDYFNTEAFSVLYGDVLNVVWTYIRNHKERVELVVRLAQEVVEGMGQCTNGKMARLVNVLRGFDLTMEDEAPPKQVFYGRIALLKKEPKDKRSAQAQELFTEFNIPVEEHNVWLEPLMDDDA